MGRLAFGALLETINGGIIAVYATAGDQIGFQTPIEELKGKQPGFTTDGGRTWKYGYENIPKADHMFITNSCHSSIKSGGDFFRCRDVWGPKTILAGWHHADGTVEDPTYRPMTGPPEFETSAFGSLRGIERHNGDFILAGYTKLTNEPTWCVIVIKSSDKGETWEFLSIVAANRDVPWAQEGPNECCIGELPNHDLYVVFRTGATAAIMRGDTAQKMGCSRSTDDGKTWKVRTLPFGGVAPNFHMMKNGTAFLTFGRPGNALRFSRNNAESWSEEVSLSRADARTTGYCDAMEVEPGRVLAVFDTYDSPTTSIWLWEPKLVNTFWGVFVEVD